MRFETPANLSLQSLNMKPLQQWELHPLKPVGYWLASEKMLLAWRPYFLFEARWDGGKALLVSTSAEHLFPLEQVLTTVKDIKDLSKDVSEQLSGLEPPRIVRLALIAGGELKLLSILPPIRSVPEVMKRLSAEKPTYMNEVLRVSADIKGRS
jgi:hypothetical protein